MSDFYKEFKEKIDRDAHSRGSSQSEVFFTEVTDLLKEEALCLDAINCHFEMPTSGSKLGIQIDGYGGNPIDSQNTLTIFLVDFSFSDEIEIINNGFNGMIIFKNKKIELKNNNSLTDVLFDVGIEKINFKEFTKF